METMMVHEIETEQGRERLLHASAIVAKDVDSNHTELMYGDVDGDNVVVVLLDKDTDEYEYLYAAIAVLRGYDPQGILEGVK